VERVGEQSILCAWERSRLYKKGQNNDECAKTSRRQCCVIQTFNKTANKVSCVMQVIKNFPQIQCTLLVDL